MVDASGFLGFQALLAMRPSRGWALAEPRGSARLRGGYNTRGEPRASQHAWVHGEPSMVWRRMGLLDDAIREHLELKRLRGADPGVVAREEREALRAVRDGEPTEHHAGDRQSFEADFTDDDGQECDEDGQSEQDGHRNAAVVDGGGYGDGGSGGFSNVGQETLELDMRAVLDEEPDSGAQPADAD